MPDRQESAKRVVDLTNCEFEPIHIPGRVQPHGVLLSLSEPDLIVVQASENAADLLGVAARDLIGTGLEGLVDAGHWPCIREVLTSADPSPSRLTLRGEEGLTFNATAHRHNGALILELENGRPGDPGPPPDHSRTIRRAMSRLQRAASLMDFCRVAVAEMRALIGFDRVTVYRFDAQWNGQVLAEECRPGLEPLLGLHFPASDIPEQARRLYHLNPIRLIADVGYTPARLVPELDPATGAPLDLTYAALRSVSPIHIQYLKNMGATASLSVSLMREGRLWGLLSCMHYDGPRYLPPDVRAACEFLGVLVSVQLGIKEDSEDVEYKASLQSIREELLRRMSETADLVQGLTGREPGLLDLTAAQGAAIVFDGDCATLGATPDVDQIKRLVQWLKVHTEGEVFHTDSLPRLLPEAEAYKETASGLVSIATSKAHGHYVLWFRPEVIQAVNWGGDPKKQVVPGPGGPMLSPRTSFERWKEVVRLKSLPWKACELDAARGLRDVIIAVVVRRAEELTRLNVELARSNTDLDAFAYIASHDLKEPLRGIHNYATFLLEDYAEKLEPDGTAKLETLVRLSKRMEDLIESLLRYSRLGREELSVVPVDLNELVAEVLDSLQARLLGPDVEIRIPRPLPVVRCDRVGIGEVLSNLVANAIKYNLNRPAWVEIGYAEPVRPAEGMPTPPGELVLYVRDNGIGIPEKHALLIFRLFKRLHGRDKFGGGTGAGLTIAKKIVERHGGSIWVESGPEQGSTFYFTLRV
ncbi:ATP-binding protein [Isosphaeraceae bacterium EP7]